MLRITLTASDLEATRHGTIAILFRPLSPLPGEIVLHVSRSVRRVPGPLSRCKTTSRAAEAVALREAHRAGAFDAILLNPSDRVAETTARNLFMVVNGVAETPPTSEGALEGVTRRTVFEVARRLGIETRESPSPMEKLLGAEEVFITGSGVGVAGVAQVHAHRYTPVPGPVTKRLAEAYERILDAEAKW